MRKITLAILGTLTVSVVVVLGTGCPGPLPEPDTDRRDKFIEKLEDAIDDQRSKGEQLERERDKAEQEKHRWQVVAAWSGAAAVAALVVGTMLGSGARQRTAGVRTGND